MKDSFPHNAHDPHPDPLAKGEGIVLIERFLEMMAAERRAARSTLEAYRRDLRYFEAYAVRKGVAVERTDAQLIETYLASLAAESLSPRTQARQLSAIRQFYHFLASEKFRKDNPAAAVSGPKQPRSLPKLLTQADILRLIDAARRKDAKEAVRLAAMLEMLYASGMRVSELVGLRLKDVQGIAGKQGQVLIAITGKGGKERLVPLNQSAKAALRDYLEMRKVFLKSSSGKGKHIKILLPPAGGAGGGCQDTPTSILSPQAGEEVISCSIADGRESVAVSGLPRRAAHHAAVFRAAA